MDREDKSCRYCYWYSHAPNDPAFCDLVPHSLCVIDDESIASECCSFITRDETDEIIRWYLRNK